MSKILQSWWFQTADELVGIIKTEDEITGEIKFRIGCGDGVDREKDEKILQQFGARFDPAWIR